MTKIQQLLEKYCPDGVEFKRLGEVINILDNQRKPISRVHRQKWEYPYYWANGIQDYIHDYIFDGTFILLGEDWSVINKDGSPVLNWVTGRIWVNNHAHILSEKPDEALLKYVYFALSELNVRKIVKWNIPKITQRDLRNFRIPIPHIEVQKEIVKVLDTFTILQSELESKLRLELEARKKQYEYYKDEMLTFKENEVEWKTIKELFDFKNWLNKKKEFFGKGTPIVNFNDVFKNRLLYANDIRGKVEVTNKEKALYEVQVNDLFFTRTSETKEDIGMVSAVLEKIDSCVFSGFILRARPKTKLLDSKFCSYYFTSYQARKEIIKNSTFTTRALTSWTRLSKIKIPIPTLKKQQEIVSLLDKFDVLVKDTWVDIPTEIAARKQQYEYYREKLLTFKELEK